MWIVYVKKHDIENDEIECWAKGLYLDRKEALDEAADLDLDLSKDPYTQLESDYYGGNYRFVNEESEFGSSGSSESIEIRVVEFFKVSENFLKILKK